MLTHANKLNLPLDWRAIWERRGHAYNEACRKIPSARTEEHDLFLRDLNLQSGQTFLDVAAGGGEISNLIFDRFGETVEIIAIEPSTTFASGLNPAIQHLSCPITSFSLPDSWVDRIANFACLHHVRDTSTVFGECYRVLKQGGVIGIADVRRGSNVDIWLNTFVDRHNSLGHQGFFFDEGELSEKIQTAGFTPVCERRVQYTWNFDTVEDMVWYCQNLFGMDKASEEQVHDGIAKILDYAIAPTNKQADAEVSSALKLRKVRMNWELIHAFGIK